MLFEIGYTGYGCKQVVGERFYPEGIGELPKCDTFCIAI